MADEDLLVNKNLSKLSQHAEEKRKKNRSWGKRDPRRGKRPGLTRDPGIPYVRNKKTAVGCLGFSKVYEELKR